MLLCMSRFLHLIVVECSDADGPAYSAVGEQEDCRVHRRGRANAVGLHLQEGHLAQLSEQHSRRHLYG